MMTQFNDSYICVTRPQWVKLPTDIPKSTLKDELWGVYNEYCGKKMTMLLGTQGAGSHWTTQVPRWRMFNSLRPTQNGCHFADNIFKYIWMRENVWILINISLKFVPKGPINNIPALVHIMAWCHIGNKALSEPMVVSLPRHICVTRPDELILQKPVFHTYKTSNWSSWTLPTADVFATNDFTLPVGKNVGYKARHVSFWSFFGYQWFETHFCWQHFNAPTWFSSSLAPIACSG